MNPYRAVQWLTGHPAHPTRWHMISENLHHGTVTLCGVDLFDKPGPTRVAGMEQADCARCLRRVEA